MIVLLSILIGFYIVADSIYLAAKANGENRFCILARYAGAVMCGLYLMFDSNNEEFILFGTTIALFMWPDTFYRIYQYIQIRHPACCNYLPGWIMNFMIKLTPRSRRNGDYETHY